MPSYRNNQSSVELSQIASQVDRITHQQRHALHILTDIRESKREGKARELYARLETMQGEFCGRQVLIDKWRPGLFSNESSILQGCSSRIAAGDFINVAVQMDSAEDRMCSINKDVLRLNAQDGERRFVLEALQEVIKEMDWKEVVPPILSDPNNPASPIWYVVDTYYAGEIQFSLALDGIKCHSDISNDAKGCYKEFNNITEKLKLFGVKTEFKKVDSGDEDPMLLEIKNLDIPSNEQSHYNEHR